jgi:predicted nucleotidyltransferase
MDINDILKEVSSIVADELFCDYQLFLFGSRAKDINDDKSDIDIGIISKTRISGRQFLSIQEKVENLPTLLKIDLVDFNSVVDDFKKTALKYTRDIKDDFRKTGKKSNPA